MFKTSLLLMATLCGLAARSPAQVHIGFNLGKRVSVHARVGPVVFHTGSRYRVDRGRRTRYSVPRRHYRGATTRVWVPARYDRVYEPARYRWTCGPYGQRTRVLVHPARYRQMRQPGYWKYGRHRVRARY